MSDKYCVLQDDIKDCGVSCLLSIIKYYGGYVSREYLKELTNTNKNGVNALNLIKAARELGFESYGVKGKLKNIKSSSLPLIANVLIEKKLTHFVVIYKIDMKKNKILVMDPSKGYVYFSFSEFQSISTNYFLMFKVKQVIPKLEENNSTRETIVNLLKKYRFVFVSIFLISFVYTISNILSSYNFKFLFDEMHFSSDYDLKIVFLFLLFLIFLRTSLNLLRGNLINYINEILDKTLVKNAFYHIINLPYLYYKNHTNGDLLTRINDLGNIKELISNLMVSIFVDLILALMIIIIMLKINFSLLLITIISLILYNTVAIFSNNNIKENIKESFSNSSAVNNFLIESLASFETIKNFSLQNYIFHQFENKYHKLNNINHSILKKINTENFFKNIILAISNLLIIYVGINLIKSNILSVTSLITYLSLSEFLISPIKNLLDLQFLFISSKESIRRIKEIYQIPNEKLLYSKNSIKNLEGRIEFLNVSYSYNGINEILKDVSLNINNGEKVLICGSSGSGKSTLMELLIRYLDNNFKGDIFIDGFNIRDIDLFSLRKNICYVSQNEYIYTDSVYNNITLGRKVNYKDFLAITKNLCINEIVKHSSVNYEYLLENNGENISGGEKARIIIARSIIKNSNIYIFDETFSSLDINLERKILKYLFDNYTNKTFIIISHRISNIDLFNQKIMLGDGYVRKGNELT